jgi:hypothetical protein
VLSEITSADWTRLTHFLEAKFPELRENKNQSQVKEGCVHGE